MDIYLGQIGIFVDIIGAGYIVWQGIIPNIIGRVTEDFDEEAYEQKKKKRKRRTIFAFVLCVAGAILQICQYWHPQKI